MSFKLGIIPAAGKGSRWGGYNKELLPVSPGCWLINYTVDAMLRGGADALLVVTNETKLPALVAHLKGVPVYYALQRGNRDIWSAIEEGLDLPADYYLFGMPDTLYPADVFERMNGAFSMGLFETTTPERFGVLHGGHVVNKQRLDGDVFKAWGVLGWSRSTAELWRDRQPETYTEAINMALEDVRDTQYIDMATYHDMATFKDYHDYLLHAS